jgi:hypothetical protein
LRAEASRGPRMGGNMSQHTDSQTDPIESLPVTRDELRQQLSDAQDALNGEVYRLDVAEISLRMAEEEIDKLESLTLAGIMSSFFGNKAGQIDALREKCEELQRELQERARTIETLERQVEQIKQQTEALGHAEAEPQVRCVPGSGQVRPGDSHAEQGTSKAVAADAVHRIERAIDAGELVLSHLSGAYGVCSRLRSGQRSGGRGGALLAAVLQSGRNRTADYLTSQIAESVEHFCNQLGQLGFDSENPADAEILSAISQLRRFADLGSGALGGTNSDGWAELEILTRGLVSDLQDIRAQWPEYCG